jgi:hypothetical protein
LVRSILKIEIPLLGREKGGMGRRCRGRKMEEQKEEGMEMREEGDTRGTMVERGKGRKQHNFFFSQILSAGTSCAVWTRGVISSGGTNLNSGG